MRMRLLRRRLRSWPSSGARSLLGWDAVALLKRRSGEMREAPEHARHVCPRASNDCPELYEPEPRLSRLKHKMFGFQMGVSPRCRWIDCGKPRPTIGRNWG